MMIFLQHPVHGRKIAIMEAEAEHDEKNGWTRYDPEAVTVEAPQTDTVDEIPQFLSVNTLTVKNRPGRPRKVD